MTNSLEKLVKSAKSMEQFVIEITRFPHFYLRTDEEKRMTKKDLREFYTSKGGETIR